MKRSPSALLEDVDSAAEMIGGYIKGIDFEAFEADAERGTLSSAGSWSSARR